MVRGRLVFLDISSTDSGGISSRTDTLFVRHWDSSELEYYFDMEHKALLSTLSLWMFTSQVLRPVLPRQCISRSIIPHHSKYDALLDSGTSHGVRIGACI